MSRTKQLVSDYVLMLAVASLVMFANLGGARLWDRDEPRNAGCAEEMLRRGDWVTPVFNGQLRDAKPVLLYWLIMSAYGLFGVNEFAARFWSAALAVATVLATYGIGRRLYSPSVGLWSAIVLATSLMFDVAGRAATPDSVLISCGTLALLVYVLGTFRPKLDDELPEASLQPRAAGQFFPTSWPVVALMYAFMGLGVLAKGPVGFVVPTAIIGMFLLIVRLPARTTETTHHTWRARIAKFAFAMLRPFEPRHFARTCWSMRPLTAIAVVFVIALPWYVWVGLRTDGQFLLGFFVREHFGRATAAMENHRGPIFFYPLAILIGFLPWSVFAWPVVLDMVRRLRRGDAWQTGYILAACWVGVYVGIFTLAKTKLPSYVTPCYPALALLTGCFLHHWTSHTSLASRFGPRLAMWLLIAVGVLLVAGLPVAAMFFLPGEQWLGVVGLIPLVGAVAGLVLSSIGRSRQAGIVLGTAAVAFSTVVFGFVTLRVDRHQESHLLFNAIAQRSENPRIGAFGCLESTWVFYAKRPIRELTLNASEQAAGFEQSVNQPDWVPAPPTDVKTFFASGDAFLITSRRHLERLKPELPDDVEVLAEAQYFLKRDQLLVIGRRSTMDRTADANQSATRR